MNLNSKRIQHFDEVSGTESDIIVGDKKVDLSPTANNSLLKYWKLFVGALVINVVILLSITSRSSPQAEIQYIQILKQQPSSNVFKFQVYCPISYYANLSNFDGSKRSIDNNTYGPYAIQSSSVNGTDFDPSRTYIIEINSKKNDSGIEVLQYCGLARSWNGSCSSPVYACTSPGPMFDLLVGQTIDVIWINQLCSKFVPIVTGIKNTCMDPQNKDPAYCSLVQRSDQNVKIYKSPNSMHGDGEDQPLMRIGSSNWPTSTHIHGLQVRPQFDGNPLSWVSNSGKKGEGVISLDTDCYYDSFNNTKNTLPPKIKFTNSIYTANAKINRYLNKQNPGNLWYHDHAMHLTAYNVASGLNGVYIIRDPEVQKLLPTGKYQKFLLKTLDGWVNQDYCVSDKGQCLFQSDVPYRYRILNSAPTKTIQISFVEGTCENINCKTPRIPFTIIGADSSLFNETMPGIDRIQLGSAERIELVMTLNRTIKKFSICQQPYNATIDFSPDQCKFLLQSSPLDKNSQNIITYHVNAKGNNRLLKQVTYFQQNQKKILGVPFTNLSLVQDKDINVFRMRPLIMSYDFKFMVNGHLDFHKGAAQNPIIGSIEDWYIINTINIAHPIHVHLILYQVTQNLLLRFIKDPKGNNNCSFYEMDFLLQAIILNNDTTIKSLLDSFVNAGQINYTKFCSFYKGSESINITINNITNSVQWKDLYYGGIDAFTYDVNKQNVIDPRTRVSGIDVRELIQKGNNSYTSILETTNCPYNTTHKYLCKKSAYLKPWYQRWKETVLVDPFNVFIFRLRWTKSDYIEGGQYFQYPTDQLLAFPGYIYHCHILSHQDKEMMRPIMLRPPEKKVTEARKPWTCNQANWEDKYSCLNEQCRIANQQDDSTMPSDGHTRKQPHN